MKYVVEGDPESTVRVIAYEDLQCSDCSVYRRMLDDTLLPKYASKVAFEHRDFPLPKHSWARQAAVARRYLGSVNPEAGIAFRRYCLERLAEITPKNFNAKLCAFAKDNGADPEKAAAALQDRSIDKQVQDEFQEGVARGVARTPTVFVNRQPFIEKFSFEEISKSIDAALRATSKAK
jgi:protein-disulfide isomerase